MKIRMKVAMSGTLDGQPWPPRGAIGDIPDRVAAKLCAAGQAEPVATRGADIETAVDDRPVQKRRGRPPGSKSKPKDEDPPSTPETADEPPVSTEKADSGS